MTNTPIVEDERVAGDLIWGAREIALEVLGEDTPEAIRKIFYLLERKHIQADKVGNQWVASKQRLRRRFRGPAF